MNKCEFIKAVAAKADLTQKDADAFYDAMLDVIAGELKGGNKVSLLGFGTFELKKKPAREGINPATKQKIKIAASNVPSFKIGGSFKDQFNK